MARDDRRKKRPMVVSRKGRYKFQTGLVTATLLERGMPAAAAFSLSRELRDRVAGRGEMSAKELEAELEALLKELGYEGLLGLAGADETGRTDLPTRRSAGGDAVGSSPGESPRVSTPHGDVPYAQHILLRDLVAIGMEPDQAVSVGRTLDVELRAMELPVLRQAQIDTVLERLLMGAGRPYFQRYRLLRWVRRADRPIVLFIGGATGTGKSTLAMEVAFRLGIRMVVSTDMIRETMRTVLSAEVVPGLHDHSFRGMLQGGRVLSNPRERVLAGFRQQAEQVAAGVRAVIRRALREQSHMIVEGTHLLPPFEQYLPSDDMPHAGLMLAVTSEDEHRERFPRRAASQGQRDASAYLEAFQSVRWIHDDLLHAAEDSEALVLSTGRLRPTATRILDFLAEVLPQGTNRRPTRVRSLPDVRTLFVILDGLSDEPQAALEDRTPLRAARTPFLDMLAFAGGQGQVVTAPRPGAIPHTDEGLWSLLGTNPPTERLGRGAIEALGQGVPLTPGAVLFRGNLATKTEDGALLDRRAGRITHGQADLLAGLGHVPLGGGLSGSIYPGLEHRVVVVLRGAGLSAAVADTDPGQTGEPRVNEARPTDASPEAARTAAALRELLAHAATHLAAHPHNQARVERGLPAANCVITRGAAQSVTLPEPQHDASDAAMIAACSTALGVARMAGMQVVTGARMTGALDTDLDAKFDAAANLLETHSLVVVHIKGTDIAAHDRRPVAKRDFIAAFDDALGRFLEANSQVTNGLRVVVTADHGTSSKTGHHLPDPVPVLVSTWRGPSEQTAFDEETAERGALGLLQPGDLARLLWQR